MALDLSGLVLHSILKDPDESLEAWSKLKLAFLGNEYISIYSAISKFYDKNSRLPTFNDLDISIRDKLIKENVKALERLDVPEDVPLDLIVDSLLNEYTQDEAVKKIDQFIDNIRLLDSEEIKQELANILLHLEEKTHTSETVCLMNELTIFEEDSDVTEQVPLGFNNTFDADVRAATTELIMIGGGRGAGKSVLACNIFNNQYLNGNTCLYFSIEMNKQETYNRMMASLSGVEHKHIRNKEFTPDDLEKMALVKSKMFVDADDILNEFYKDKDYKKFEYCLNRDYKLKQDNQLIIIDNQRLTLADIDMNIQKFKAQFGNKLKVVVVDYVNQIEIEDIYSWKQQITLSKQLKNFARKHKVLMITPYQIDNEGEARFAKGILDAADMAMTIEAHNDHITLKSTKTRGTSEFTVSSPITWDTLTMDSRDYVPPPDEDEDEDNNDEDNNNENLPW